MSRRRVLLVRYFTGHIFEEWNAGHAAPSRKIEESLDISQNFSINTLVVACLALTDPLPRNLNRRFYLLTRSMSAMATESHAVSNPIERRNALC